MLRDKWIKALRSGNYKQTTGRLCDGVGYCCLGVACDVKDPTGWDGTAHLGKMTSLSEEMRAELKLSVIQQRELIHLNDSLRANFNQIADWLEDNLER